MSKQVAENRSSDMNRSTTRNQEEDKDKVSPESNKYKKGIFSKLFSNWVKRWKCSNDKEGSSLLNGAQAKTRFKNFPHQDIQKKKLDVKEMLNAVGDKEQMRDRDEDDDKKRFTIEIETSIPGINQMSIDKKNFATRNNFLKTKPSLWLSPQVYDDLAASKNEKIQLFLSEVMKKAVEDGVSLSSKDRFAPDKNVNEVVCNFNTNISKSRSNRSADCANKSKSNDSPVSSVFKQIIKSSSQEETKSLQETPSKKGKKSKRLNSADYQYRCPVHHSSSSLVNTQGNDTLNSGSQPECEKNPARTENVKNEDDVITLKNTELDFGRFSRTSLKKSFQYFTEVDQRRDSVESLGEKKPTEYSSTEELVIDLEGENPQKCSKDKVTQTDKDRIEESLCQIKTEIANILDKIKKIEIELKDKNGALIQKQTVLINSSNNDNNKEEEVARGRQVGFYDDDEKEIETITWKVLDEKQKSDKKLASDVQQKTETESKESEEESESNSSLTTNESEDSQSQTSSNQSTVKTSDLTSGQSPKKKRRISGV